MGEVEAAHVDDPDEHSLAVMVVSAGCGHGAPPRVRGVGALEEGGRLVQRLARLDVCDRVLVDELGDVGGGHLDRCGVELPADPAGPLLDGVLHRSAPIRVEVLVELDEQAHLDLGRRLGVTFTLFDELLHDREGQILHVRGGRDLVGGGPRLPDGLQRHLCHLGGVGLVAGFRGRDVLRRRPGGGNCERW